MAYNHYILVCGGTGCESSGSVDIYENLKAAAKEFGVEDQVQIVKTGCFGFCEKGPIVKVLPEDSFYVEVKPEDAREIIAEQIVKGREVPRLLYSKEKDITLDDCENVTRSLSDFLDGIIPVKYYLEVSSPGLERKFKSEKEFIIFKGKRVSIKLKNPLESETEKVFKGEILDYDTNTGLRFFRFDDGQELLIPKDNIQSAKLYID